VLLDIIGRAFRNLVRVPGRTLLLIVVLGAIVGLAVTGLAVQAGAQLGLADAKRNMGNEVRLMPNFTAARRAVLGGQSMPEIPGVPESLVDSLAASGYVTQTDRAVTAMATSPDLMPVSDESGSGSFGPRLPAGLLDGFQVSGNSLPGEVLTSGRSERVLAEGRLYTAEEVASGAAVAVIDESLAEKNGLDLGGSFTLESLDGLSGETFTIIGLTSDVTPPEGEMTFSGGAISGGGIGMRFRLFGSSNQLLVPYTAAQRLRGQAGEVSTATFYLDDPGHLDAFRSEAESAGIDSEKYMLVADDAQAQAAAAPFEALEGFARVGVVALVIVGALVVILLMSLVTRERKLEIGVLRALGASRGSVAAQFVIETATVCLVALLIGGLIGGFAAQGSAERLLEREVAAMERGPAGRTAVLPGGISIIEGPPPTGAEAATPDISVRFGWRQVATILGIGLVLATSGSAAAVYWGMKMEPASILTSRN
jgi:putative ABC transport system permease protein